MMQEANQFSVRDPNNVGADMVYDNLVRNTQQTDTFGDVTKTEYDLAGNAIKQTDAKNQIHIHYVRCSRNRRKSTNRSHQCCDCVYLHSSWANSHR